MIWEWDLSNNNVSCKWVCKGHERSVECIKPDSRGEHIASGSWDGQLKIWTVGVDKVIEDGATAIDAPLPSGKGVTKVRLITDKKYVVIN